MPFDGHGLVAAQLGLTVALAALSFRYVETPFRRHGIAGVRAWLAARGPAGGRRRHAAGVVTAAVALVAVLVGVLPVHAPVIPGVPASGASVLTLPSKPPAAAHREVVGTSRARPRTVAAGPVLAVGDSVLLGSSPALRASFGRRLSVDAVVARQFPETAAAAIADARTLAPSVVIIHTGSNGYVPFDGLERLLTSLRDVPLVVLVTARVGDVWEGSVNDALAYAARHHPNVVLADWHGATEGRPDLLVDGVHAGPAGARAYVGVIRDAIRAATR